MAFGIVLTLDRVLADQVRQMWSEFESAGIGKTPSQYGAPPHITLAVFPIGEPKLLIELVESMPVSDSGIKLVSFGAFLAIENVLFLHSVFSPDLQRAYAQLYDAVRCKGLEHDPLFAPGNAVFHCTLAVGVQEDRFLDGVNLCLKHRETLIGSAESLELLEFYPVKVIHSRRLATSHP